MNSSGSTEREMPASPSASVAQALAEIVTRHGRGIARDRDLLASLMRDQGVPSRESFVLTTAAADGVPERLHTAKKSIPPEVFRANLIHRLSDDRGLDLVWAAWAITTWATALGLPHVPIEFHDAAPIGVGLQSESSAKLGALSRVCPFCASPTNAQRCVSCGRDTSAARKICQSCNKMVPVSDAVCWNCGQRFRNELAWKIAALVAFVIFSYVLKILIGILIAKM